MAISYPPIFINDYLAEKIRNEFGNLSVPFFPASPSTIDELTETFPNGSVFCVFDRMFRMRQTAFPHIKDEQLLYYFYSTGSNSIPLLLETTQKVQDLLDRTDESAQEVNSWLQSKLINGRYIKGDQEFLPVYFHDFTIFQLQETRDIIDFGTARTYAGNKLIISYCYHPIGEGTKKVDGQVKRTYNDTII